MGIQALLVRFDTRVDRVNRLKTLLVRRVESVDRLETLLVHVYALLVSFDRLEAFLVRFPCLVQPLHTRIEPVDRVESFYV